MNYFNEASTVSKGLTRYVNVLARKAYVTFLGNCFFICTRKSNQLTRKHSNRYIILVLVLILLLETLSLNIKLLSLSILILKKSLISITFKMLYHLGCTNQKKSKWMVLFSIADTTFLMKIQLMSFDQVRP